MAATAGRFTRFSCRSAAPTQEEARHIAYARRWLHEGMPSLDDEQVAEVRSLAELGAQALIERRFFLPVRWTQQLEPYMSEQEFQEARSVSPASRAMLRQLKQLLDEFAELRIVSPKAMQRWEDAGAFS